MGILVKCDQDAHWHKAMNNRDYKQLAQGHYYHVFNRGVGKQDIFTDDQDFLNFLKRFKVALGMIKLPVGRQRTSLSRMTALPKDAFTIICYCLMPNHFHLLIRQNTNLPISKLFAKVCTSYSKYFNKKFERVGGVFQDQYKAVLIDTDPYLLWLSAYIHNNPKAAGLAEKPEDWQYSSYLDYLGKRQGTLSEKEIILKQFKNFHDYQKFVEESFEKINQRKELKDLLLD